MQRGAFAVACRSPAGTIRVVGVPAVMLRLRGPVVVAAGIHGNSGDPGRRDGQG